MTLLQLLLDGALAAANMLVLLVVPPATATPAAGAHPDRAVHWHRLSTTTIDGRLLGTLAGTHSTPRAAHADGGPEAAASPCSAPRSTVDAHASAAHALSSVPAGAAPSNDDCGEPMMGHVRLTLDEAIADARHVAPDAAAIVAAITASPPSRGNDLYRVALPTSYEATAPLALLIDQDGAWILAVVPHRRAAAATLVLRPVSGDARWIRVGAVDPRMAVLVPLASRAQLDDLDEGAIEVELASGDESHWSTIVATRIDERPAVQAGAAD